MNESYLYNVSSIYSRSCSNAVLNIWPALYICVGTSSTRYHYDFQHDLGVMGAAHGCTLCVRMRSEPAVLRVTGALEDMWHRAEQSWLGFQGGDAGGKHRGQF